MSSLGRELEIAPPPVITPADVKNFRRTLQASTRAVGAISSAVVHPSVTMSQLDPPAVYIDTLRPDVDQSPPMFRKLPTELTSALQVSIWNTGSRVAIAVYFYFSLITSNLLNGEMISIFV